MLAGVGVWPIKPTTVFIWLLEKRLRAGLDSRSGHTRPPGRSVAASALHRRTTQLSRHQNERVDARFRSSHLSARDWATSEL